MPDDLEPITPEAAVDFYLNHRRDELTDETHKSQKYRLQQFVEWCEDNDITNMNGLSGRDLHKYRVDRREDGLKPVSLQGQLSTLRVFIGFCETIDAVEEDLRSKILLPSVTDDGDISETTLDEGRAKNIIEYLSRYHYASRDHVIFVLLWTTGMRTGSLRAIDLEDFDPENNAIEVVHRPETDTPLKNKSNGERWIALSPAVAEVVDEYVENQRIDRTDEHGRKPLLTTDQGRISAGTIRTTVYKQTRPCVYGDDCPHDRDPNDCEAMEVDGASKCPSSRSPHDIRSGAITSHLLEEVPTEVVSDRMNVSQKVLDRHYDRRTKREKMEQRRKYLRD